MKYIFFKVFFAVLDTIGNPVMDTYYSKLFDNAMNEYCFLDISYVHTNNVKEADLIVHPYIELQDCENCLGKTYGNIHMNNKIHGVSTIYFAPIIYSANNAVYTYIHEIGHFLGLQHSIDDTSIMNAEFSGKNLKLTRYDSIYLISLFR